MYSQFVAITNRHLCSGDFLSQIERLSKLGLKAIILREKDLSETEYKKLAEQVLTICQNHGTTCILHSQIEIARSLDCDKIHLPLPMLVKQQHILQGFQQIGTSCHSVADALLAQQLGATYITASHIFQTDCKPDLAPRGLAFLRAVCHAVSIPVYALGGITFENATQTLEYGAAAACMMSGFMRL
ncbi:MAG: thiamine phosphate synthase [Oscillospiraceae bacterium]|jgi:thiamine-phosphate diphosphorylase